MDLWLPAKDVGNFISLWLSVHTFEHSVPSEAMPGTLPATRCALVHEVLFLGSFWEKSLKNTAFLTIFAETQADLEAPGARGVGSMGPGRLHGPREAPWAPGGQAFARIRNGSRTEILSGTTLHITLS